MAEEEQDVAVEEEEEEDVEEEEEEDLLDPQEVLKEKCAEIPKCSKLKEEFDNCEERVNSKSKTTETCEQELLDFLQCVDSCVSKNLFDHLK